MVEERCQRLQEYQRYTLFFATFTRYSIDIKPDSNQIAAAYTSVIITFIIQLLIILYHVYTHTTLFSKISKTKLGGMIDRFSDTDPKPKSDRHWSPPPDDDFYRFNEGQSSCSTTPKARTTIPATLTDGTITAESSYSKSALRC